MEFNRRSFLKGIAGLSAAAAAGCRTSRYGFNCARQIKPGQKLNIAAIGAYGKGLSDWVPMVKRGENLVALCDVDDRVFEQIAERAKKDLFLPESFDLSKVKIYKDYRKLLDDADKLGIDAVTVSTPDHMHAAQAIRAMKQGIHCYVQKPLVRTLWEADYFGKVARATGVVTQMGNQGSSGSGHRRNVELLQQGIIGDVTEVHVWTDRPIWPQGTKAKLATQGPADAVPQGFDWDLWVGTAKARNFRAAYPDGAAAYERSRTNGVYHHFNWRGFYDFGTGAFGDMACHTMNLPFRGLELGKAVKSECIQCEEFNDVAYPTKSTVVVTYAARKSRVRPGVKLPEVKLYWYDGNQQPSAELMPQVVAALGSVPKTGCLIIGSKGIICSTNDYGQEAFIAFKDEQRIKSTFKHDACKAIAEYLPRRPEPGTEGQQAEFLDAIKGDGPVFADTHSRAFSDVEHSVPMLEGMLVGCVAQRVPGVLRWDSDNQIFDNAAANEFIRPYVRTGFEF